MFDTGKKNPASAGIHGKVMLPKLPHVKTAYVTFDLTPIVVKGNKEQRGSINRKKI